MDTKYASPERTEEKTLRLQSSWFQENKLLEDILDAVADVVFILNEQRQIVFANSSVTTRFKDIDFQNVFGSRPGEALNCEYAFKETGGCGTSEFCRTCGAVNSVLLSLKGIKNAQECRIIKKDSHEWLDLRVFSNPITVNGTKFIVYTINDISDEKRRQVLEKLFFHDILNIAGGVRGIVSLLREGSFNDTEEAFQLLAEASEHIIDEISVQKELLLAEREDLRVNPVPIKTLELLNEVNQFFKNHDSSRDKVLKINPDSENVTMLSDKTLLRRVIINLIKNALEASNKNDEVLTTCFVKDGMILFSVWNNSFIPKQIQNQIFQRSFSTKGRGRGLGTYSIKLLSEKYLNGKVEFTSSMKSGTLFTVIFPVSLKN